MDTDQDVADWAASLLGRNVLTERLSGGANNNVFRCRTATDSLIIKRYREQNFGASATRRDSEVAFLQYAARYASDFIPRLIGSHQHLEMIALSDLDGVAFDAVSPPSGDDVASAVEFYRHLNADLKAVDQYPVIAREGFLAISEHMRHVDRRLSKFSTRHLPLSSMKRARDALTHVFQTKDRVFNEVRATIYSGKVPDEISIRDLRISPGDFGFHNALKIAKKTRFFDFEYAGLDDPAKTIADFILQPRIPITATKSEEICAQFAEGSNAASIQSRVVVLGKVLSVKWATIILSPLDPAQFAHLKNHVSDLTTELNRRFDAFKLPLRDW